MTPHSMTGYARVQGNDAAFGWVWEIKTVNARGLELRTRLPAGYDGLDIAVREAATKRLRRGSVSILLTLTRAEEKALPYSVNDSLLARYAEVARRLAASPLGQTLAPASIDGLMALKGVIEAGEAEGNGTSVMDEQRLPAMMASFSQALDAVTAMRLAEGQRLAVALAALLDQITELVRKAEALAAPDPEAVASRLRQHIRALIEAVPALPEDRLLQEAALVVVRADIREELDRLTAHLAAARDMLAESGASGRRLDFLCQEFNREANTLCSKAGSNELSRIGMEMKTVIEQFREQVQNIE